MKIICKSVSSMGAEIRDDDDKLIENIKRLQLNMVAGEAVTVSMEVFDDDLYVELEKAEQSITLGEDVLERLSNLLGKYGYRIVMYKKGDYDKGIKKIIYRKGEKD